MRHFKNFTFALLLSLFLIACEDEINPTLVEAESIVVVDGFIDNTNAEQTIWVGYTQNYFDAATLQGYAGANVKVITEEGEVVFNEVGDGHYSWTPAPGETIAPLGSFLSLEVNVEGATITSDAYLAPVPEIDSVTFFYDDPEERDLIIGEFWSRDLEGEGNTYWIKSFKNGEFLSTPSYINIAFDAGFSAGGVIDNLIFIPPIRQSITPFNDDDDENLEQIEEYVDGDQVRVEIHSISPDVFDYFVQLQEQTDRPGGFGELFATPLSNLSTNLKSSSGEVVGIFNVAAISSFDEVVDVSIIE